MILSLFNSSWVIFTAYVVAAFFGAIFLPVLFSHERLSGFVSKATNSEIRRRDKLLMPLTKYLVRWDIHPNVITLIGMVLVAWLFAAFMRGASLGSLLVLTSLAGITDMFDGPVARASGKVTVSGGVFDAVRDFLLMLVVAAGFWVNGMIAPLFIVWFFAGEVFVFVLKLLESGRRGSRANSWQALLWRAAGDGKPVLDRTKFFFVILAAFFVIFENLTGFNATLAAGICFALSLGSILCSIALQSSLLRLRAAE